MQHQDQPILARHPESTQKSPDDWPHLHHLLLSSCSLGSSHTHSFSSNPKLSSFSAIVLSQLKNPWVLCIFWSHFKCHLLRKMFKNSSLRHLGFSHTYSLFHSYLVFSFSNIKKKNPETGLIHLAYIICHCAIKWVVGRESGTWFPVHLLQWRGCVSWSRDSFINWGLGFWDPNLTIPSQLTVSSDMILLFLCLHKHILAILGNFVREKKITLLYIPRSFLKNPSTLQQKISADYLYPKTLSIFYLKIPT